MVREEYTRAIEYFQYLLRREFGIVAFIGAEVEFYLKKKCHTLGRMDTVDCLGGLQKFSNYVVKEEKGNGQYEYLLDHTSNFIELINCIDSSKRLVRTYAHENGLYASFLPKPISNDYGSALQYSVHLELVDESGVNVFSCMDSLENNHYLMYSLNGVLMLMPGLMDSLFSGISSDYNVRLIAIERARLSSHFMAPTRLTWSGPENRTAAIRVARCKSGVHHYRMELRIASPITSTHKMILFILQSIFYGLTHKRAPSINRLYGNAWEYSMYQSL